MVFVEIEIILDYLVGYPNAITGVLIRRRQREIKRRREGQGVRNASGHQKPVGARNGFSPRASRGNPVLSRRWFQPNETNFGILASKTERIKFWSFKSLQKWHFVTAIGQQIYCANKIIKESQEFSTEKNLIQSSLCSHFADRET